MKFIYKVIALTAFLVAGTFTSNAQVSNKYILNPGDELHISVWREDTLDKQVTVLPDGNITFPLIGSVSVVGVSSIELEQIIEEKLSDHIPDAEVTVLINSVSGNQVYVIGKVTRPGAFIMNAPMTVSQVLSLAGGLDRFADANSIKVQRFENGSVTYMDYNYDNLLSGENNASMEFVLKAGDVVVVP